jgi:transcriptional regulator with XRE-family HTH domain
MTNLFLRAKERSKLSYREIAKRFGCSSVHMVHLMHDPGRSKDPDVLLNLASMLGIKRDDALSEWKQLRAKHVRNLAERQLERESL